MRFLILRGVIERRMLVNYRVEPEVLARQLPAPFEPKLYAGRAVVGFCLIRLRGVRPRGFPELLGLRSENAAQRAAVRWTQAGVSGDGVYIRRRDTNSRLNTLAGGLLVPGEHHHARFDVQETIDKLAVEVASDDGETRIAVRARLTKTWPADSIFETCEAASQFFAAGSLGYSAIGDVKTFQGLESRCRTWHAEPLSVEEVRSSYFDDSAIFPPGSIALDNALLMREIQHEWIGRADLCCGAAIATPAAVVAGSPAEEPVPLPGLAAP